MFGLGIKNIQRGGVSVGVGGATATISSVDVNKSILIVNQATSHMDDRGFCRAVLTNPTTVTFDPVSYGNAYVAWQVIEFL